ncbi:hypothetical protein FOCC_FOCC015218, partial [Frankliniella occidentalis]
MPPIPTTLRQAALSLQQPEFAYLARNSDDTSDFFQGMVGKPGEESLLFVDTEFMKFVRSSSVLLSDATFYCCPRMLGAKQVLIVAFHGYGQVFAFAYAVMTRKTIGAYEAVFKKLKELGLRAKLVCTDWEKGEQKAWKNAFPSIVLWGCLFHYQRALYRQAKKKGLARYLKKGKTHREISRIIKLLLVIPRLPAEEIENGFKAVQNEAEKYLDVDKLRKMRKLFKYFQEEWLDRVSPSTLSVHEKNITVTSGLESVNARVNDLVPTKHPHFWIFLDLLRDYAAETFQRFDKLRFGKGKLTKSKYYVAPDKRLTDADIQRHLELFKRNRDHIDFLSAVQTTLQNVLLVLETTEEDHPDNIPTEEEVLALNEVPSASPANLPNITPPRRTRRLRIISPEPDCDDCDDPGSPAEDAAPSPPGAWLSSSPRGSFFDIDFQTPMNR